MGKTITGWWYTYPSEKYEFVSWGYEIPTEWKNKIHVPNHQPDNKPPMTGNGNHTTYRNGDDWGTFFLKSNITTRASTTLW